MENLQRNISGLNTIYEIQLKSVSGQIDTIDHINSGLNRIRNMYDSTVVDSSTFQKENERLAIQLSELNRVYARILEALTTNMNMGAGVAGQPFHSAATYTNTSSSYTETSTTKSDNIKA
jgi:ABC-type phosphate transport system auxiliary subunit